LVGGFACIAAASRLRATLPVAVIPATISNNVPGTDRSIGSDTACNVVCEAVDRLKQSAVGSRNRVFVVEVMGRRCGYLAQTAGIGSGAEAVYTHEQGISLSDLMADVSALQEAFSRGKSVGIVLAADGASQAYDIHTLARIYGEESGGRFDTRVCVLGHLQQGGRPSPADRVLAARMARAAVAGLLQGEGGMFGVSDGVITATPIDALQADSVNRRPMTRRRGLPDISRLPPR
jgi:6-phosphofructokinase 1